MAKVTEATQQRLRPIFPPWYIPVNPFDLGVTLKFGNPLKVYQTLVESMVSDPNVDAIHIFAFRQCRPGPPPYPGNFN